MSEKATAKWTDQCPAKADAGDAYYFVRRKDKLDVVVMGFSMGKGWLNGVSYEANEMRNHLFLGPITPDLFAEVGRLREALAKAAIPYEAILMDGESRRWVAPEVWAAIETAVMDAR